MKDWLSKYGVGVCTLFIGGLNIYMNLQNWKKQGTNLMPLAATIVITFLLWGLLLIAILFYYSKQRKLAERLRQPPFNDAVIDQIKIAGKLESLAGRGEWLGRNLEEVWHEFDKEKKSMPNPIGIRSIPDVVEQHTDKQLWRFRVHYQGYIGSMGAVDPQCDSDLMKHSFPHEGETYLSVKRKIEAHIEIMRSRAVQVLSNAKAEMTK